MDATSSSSKESRREKILAHRRLFDQQVKDKMASLSEIAGNAQKKSPQETLADGENEKLSYVAASTRGGATALSLATKVTSASASAQLMRIDAADLHGSAVNMQRAAYTASVLLECPIDQPVSPVVVGGGVDPDSIKSIRLLCDNVTTLLLRVISVQRSQLRSSTRVHEGLSSFRESLEEHVLDDKFLEEVAMRAQSDELLSLLAVEVAESKKELSALAEITSDDKETTPEGEST